ncbi:acetyl-CoA carboxylase biotin carboxyl carrier protein [Tepidibacter formicigenes]|jgi:acetyl-CoA carboxylase biotin carboxyl carrier protein|uniref:Biotin carboxyl carrier protein of acetyl-CoA carboxylase n=1 Tax=Tepidibacter formicigenes DSM 15518 TaxID=1123349 RepID=A0A1M6MAI2_9FIRM|nr:acetyl-CoA carboxylase biotin carboxyl carrier protein [Tepidibacter formicigenes]SHJ80452.1 acetyl-CoA carboxylase biotin carboxyl carrier protein [Tepidibacter formicigenes DSM 15518]
MNIKDIKELILTIDRTSINKFDIELDNLKLSIEKGEGVQKKVVTQDDDVKEEVYTQAFEKEENVKNEEDLHIVNAPLMGTFYRASSPDAPPYVNIGSKVKKGDKLCILEAMKLMNEIECEVEGEIVEILAENEELVEYAQPLFKIKI